MKKLVFVTIAALAFTLVSNPISAQVSVELDFSYSSPGGDFADSYDGGVGIAIHPRFNIRDQMAVGLLIGVDAFVGGDYSDPANSGLTASVSAAGIVAILGTFQYKILDRKITPYGEIGVGSYKYTAGTVDATSAITGAAFEDTSYFGVAPKIGAMAGFFNIYAAYVAAGDLKYTQFGLGFRFGSK
ncbi:MAG: hypothetical protein GY816_06240 [Cytophagales bacterium]|nr:hypothetical protein [Cytophagales bacterium]